jgi:hypothetical protein
MKQACECCRRKVIWAYTDNGSRMILDCEPSSTGPIVVTQTPDGLHARILPRHQRKQPQPDIDPTTRYRSHYLICPESEQQGNQHKPRKRSKSKVGAREKRMQHIRALLKES